MHINQSLSSLNPESENTAQTESPYI